MFSLKTCAPSGRNTRKKAFLLILAMSMLSMVLMGAMYDSQKKDVTVMVIDNFSGVDMVKTSTTSKSNVREILDEIYVSIDENDISSHELDDVVNNGETITIKRGRSISVTHDGITETVVATDRKISDALATAGIVVNDEDIIYPSSDAVIKEGDEFSIVRVTRSEYTVEEWLPHHEFRVDDDTLYVGETEIRQEGAYGHKIVTYSVRYNDGVEAGTDFVSEELISPSVDRIIAVGTKERENTYKGFTYTKKLTVNASAYEPYNCGGDGRGITASGMKAQFGVVAVDPKVIPLGTKLYIESTDDGQTWTYGYAIAADTGGAIKGNKIDLCYNTRSECIQFGRRSATVYVLG